MKVKAYAKINITLDISQKTRIDGYHELKSVIQAISLHDDLEILTSESKAENKIILKCNQSDIPCDQQNLCWKAAEIFAEIYNIRGKEIYINLKKNIPFGAGLGGGSSDCAETLKALNNIFNVHATDEELQQIGTKIGADVPFFIQSGTQLACGIGEKLTKINLALPNNVYVVIIKPPINLISGDIYKTFDNLPKECIPQESTKLFFENLQKNLGANAFKSTSNMLEPAARVYCPEIDCIKKKLIQYGAIHSMMTGSGLSLIHI